MATIKIEPIVTKSSDNSRVVITGIAPTDHDCIVGQYWIKQDGPHDAIWNLSGIVRGGPSSANLNAGNEELTEVAKLLRKLGAAS